MAIVITKKGTSTSGSVSSLTITAGAAVIACTNAKGSDGSPTCTYNDGSDDYGMNEDIREDYSGRALTSIWSVLNASAASGSGSVTFDDDGADRSGLTVFQITGLLSANAFDTSSGNQDRDTTPTSEATDQTTAQADEAIVGVIGTGPVDGTWNGDIDSTNEQYADNSSGGNGTVQSGANVVSSTGNFTCSKTGMTKDYWAACIATYKGAAAAERRVFITHI